MLRALILLFFAAPVAFAQTALDVWPQGARPGGGAEAAETDVPRGDGVRRVTNVSAPTLTLFPARRADATPAPALIVCPGGGYGLVVLDKEGSEIAEWLNGHGITALVLKYRTPGNREGALQDLQRAVSLARANATEWKIDPGRVGVIGFSAGGHLAARASAPAAGRAYAAIDAADARDCRPDFAILVYPAYLDDKAGQVAPELNYKAGIPPTLIIHSEDDRPHVVGSKIYHDALSASGIAHGFKLYASGGHGYGLRCKLEAGAWPDDALIWLRSIGVR